MGLRSLLDEDTERDLTRKLRHAGYDVKRVVETDELGTGATDDEVRTYARRTVESSSHTMTVTSLFPPASTQGCSTARISASLRSPWSKSVLDGATVLGLGRAPPVVYLTEERLR